MEHQRWEQTRLNAATSRYGAKDAKSKQKQYDLLTEDDMIEFVQAATRKGTVKDEGRDNVPYIQIGLRVRFYV